MNKTALITGGSHNIGQGIAIVLAEHGYDVAITYNSRKDGAIETQQEIEKLGRKCFIYQASLEKAEVPQQIVDQAHKDLGRLDLMVCNAGNGGFRGSILTITPENVDEVYTVNFRNYMLCACAALFCRRPVTLRGGDCVSKSYEDFWRDYTRLGGKMIELD